jgi:hypothetical protein
MIFGRSIFHQLLFFMDFDFESLYSDEFLV